jgi:hypothetical protein
MVQKKWPKNTLTSLIREAAKSTTSEHPDYLDWHDKAEEKKVADMPNTSTSSSAPAKVGGDN